MFPRLSEHRSNSMNTRKGQVCFPIIIRKLTLSLPWLSFLGGHHIPMSHIPSTHHFALWRPLWIWVRPVLELLAKSGFKIHKTITCEMASAFHWLVVGSILGQNEIAIIIGLIAIKFMILDSWSGGVLQKLWDPPTPQPSPCCHFYSFF